MTRKVILPNEELLLDINKVSNYDHLFKRKDIGMVSGVVDWLHGFGHEVFLGGSAVTNWVRHGTREYNDIDLLACPAESIASEESEPARLKLIRACYELAQKGKARIGRSIFALVDMGRDQVYLSGSTEGRFKLSPVSPRKSDIDLSIVSREKFYS